MKKMIAFSTAAAMMLTMGTAAFADISTGIVGEEKNEWPNEFGFGGEIKVVKRHSAIRLLKKMNLTFSRATPFTCRFTTPQKKVKALQSVLPKKR